MTDCGSMGSPASMLWQREEISADEFPRADFDIRSIVRQQNEKVNLKKQHKSYKKAGYNGVHFLEVNVNALQHIFSPIFSPIFTLVSIPLPE